MAYAQQVVNVNHPIGEVFAFLADGLNNPKWRPEVISISHVSGTGVGAQYAQTIKGPAGRPIAGDYRVTGFQEPTRLEFEVTAGPARPVGSFALRETGPTWTEVTFTLDLKPRGLMMLMAPVINRHVKVEAANIANLKGAMGD